MNRSRLNWRPLLVCLGLGVATLATFWPVSRSAFIGLDDPDYVKKNPQVLQGLTWRSVGWAFTTGFASNWHPLTWISHMVDVQLFGLKPGWHHCTSLILHLANTLLLFLVLRCMTGAIWRSAIVAALFALHPLHVESVAWISERKDVLSTLFFFLTLFAYVKYVETKVQSPKSKVQSPQPPAHASHITSHTSLYYLLALVFFALGLMSKPMLVTLPFVLLILDYWPLRRVEIKNQKSKIKNLLPLVFEKLPFLALSVAASIVTFMVQRHGEAVVPVSDIPLDLRIENALVSYAVYLEKMVWPAGLAVYYPFSRDIAPEVTASAAVSVLVLSLLALLQWRQRPHLAVGWLWYLGMLVPVIGLVQVGLQARADRYTYVPLIGIFIALVWEVGERTSGWRYGRSFGAAAGAAVIAVCLVLTARQLRFWRNSVTLFERTLALTTNNFVIHLDLGNTLLEQGELAGAEKEFAEAAGINPRYADAQYNWGTALAMQGKLDEAINHFRAALDLKPRSEDAHFLLGCALGMKGRVPEAIEEYRTSLALKPNQLGTLNNLVWILATNPDPQFRDGNEAVKLGERLCDLTKFKQPMFVGTLAAAYAEAGRFGDAIKASENAKSLAAAAGNKELVEKNMQLLELYRTGKPYREDPTAAKRIE
jgi:tetratricopeptide (TPR) repeat protein